jgi:F-type H+-transporting ATPase subunit b
MSYYRKFILVVLLYINTSYAVQADEGKAGLPQLDFNTYPSLVFWSVVSLIIGYILMKYLVTPNIKSILNNRETNIQNDLVKAKTSSQETEKIKENIINSQTEIKSRSQLIVNQALAESKQNIEKKEKDINQKLNEKLVNAEKQIMETQKLVIKEVINNAEELTAKVIQNLTDLKYDKVDGKKAINTASKDVLVEK